MIKTEMLDEWRNGTGNAFVFAEKIIGSDMMQPGGFRVKSVEFRYFKDEEKCRQYFSKKIRSIVGKAVDE